MALRDSILDGLRQVFGGEREERRDAASPSAAAMAAQPSSMFSIYGRDDLGGLLSVSQILMDRFADYEAMEEYPDIGCLAEGTLVYHYEGSIVRPVPIEKIATEGEGMLLLAFDIKRKRICAVQANNPRLTALEADVLKLQLANGRTIRVTYDHKFLTVDGYLPAKELKKGALLVGMFAGFNPLAMTALVEPRHGTLELVADPSPDGKAKVYDITTETHNFIVEGVVAHNSTFRFFANDAVQPSITDGRVIWTVTDDDAIRGVCDDLLHKKLRAEYELWSQAYSTDMYGNNYEELLVTENGVVGTNHLPAPTMRRVEALDGSLIGYVQDITGQFTANSHELRAMLAGNIEIPKSLALFEDWQVVHFRLRSTRRRSPYGVSVAEGARWIWKRLVMLEDAAMIYRLQRIPRYAFYVDVTDVPPDRVEGFLKKMKRDLKKKKMVNPATGRLDMRYKPLAQDEDFIVGVREGRDLARVEVVSAPDWQTIEDIDYFKRMLHGTLNVPRAWLGQDEPVQGKGVLCLTGDTKVPLLDGRTKTMAELAADYGPGKDFYVYSIGPDGSVVAGRAHSPQMTRPNAEVWEVELDNGEKVRGTPDHPFMLRDGSYRRLDELKPNDSLMPLYRRDSIASRDGIDGYDMVLNPSDEKWMFTHRVAAAGKWPQRSLKAEGRVIHHTDFDKRNNDPRNLSDPTKEDHLEIHRKHADLTLRRPEVVQKAIEASRWWTGSEANKDQCRQNLATARAPGGGQNEWCKSDEHRQLKSDQMIGQWDEPDSALMARTQTVEFSRASSAKMKESHALGKIKTRGADNAKFRHDASFARLVEVAASYRCTGIKPLAKWTGYSTCLIYRLVRDAGMTYKEFANKHLVNGYKLCAPGKNHKVVSAKRIENADCYDFVVDGVHNYALAAGIFVHNSNEDVRAARVTLNLQQEIKLGYERICRVHLAARGMKNPYDAEFAIQMTVPSGIYELAAYEVLNARADYATRIAPFTSVRWVQENVMHMGDAEISAIEKQRKREAEEGLGMGGGMPGMGGGAPPPMPPAPPSGGGSEQPAGGETGQAIPEPPAPNAPQREWRAFDQSRRLEEYRYRESNRRHGEIMDKLGRLLENGDTEFAMRERDRREFFSAFKKNALNNVRGHITAAPAGRRQPDNGASGPPGVPPLR